jgi:hypothetical protein
VARWSNERYALDKRFVQLTLLLDQGEDAPGPCWQRGSETLHDLGEVLARAPEPAVVVLGPPGSGKSTLLRHYELDCAHVAPAGWCVAGPGSMFRSSRPSCRNGLAPVDRHDDLGLRVVRSSPSLA